MDLLKNPLHILGASTRDNRHRIMEIAEERSLLSDADECMEARTVLINPRKRISAEVAWLPCVDPDRTDDVLKQLDPPHQDLLNIIGLTPISRANVLTAGLSRLSDIASNNLVDWIFAIAQAFERIDPEEVQGTLNEERRLSGFPQITDLSVITAEIQNQRRYYSQTLSSVIKNLSVNERARVLTLAIEWSTGNDKTRCPILIEDLVTSYERGVEEFLEKKQKIIEAQDEKIRVMVDAKNPDTALQPIVNQLIQTVKEWDTIAQPIQLSKRSRGERHSTSFEIAWRVRNLAYDLFSEYGKFDFSRKIINMLKEVFAEVPEVSEHITADFKALRGIEKLEEIKNNVEKLKEAADTKKHDTTLAPMVNQLIQTVKTWDTSTQPIEANEVIAIVVRNVALHIWNVHHKLYYAKQITNTLYDVFIVSKSVGIEVAQRLIEDKATLIKLDAQRKLIDTVQRRSTQRPADTGCLMQIIFGLIGLMAVLLQGC